MTIIDKCDSCKNLATTIHNCENCTKITQNNSLKNMNLIGGIHSIEELLVCVKTIEDNDGVIIFPECIIEAVLSFSTEEDVVENYEKILCSSTVTKHLEVIMDEIEVGGENIDEEALEKEEPKGYSYKRIKNRLILYKYLFSETE